MMLNLRKLEYQCEAVRKDDKGAYRCRFFAGYGKRSAFCQRCAAEQKAKSRHTKQTARHSTPPEGDQP